MTPTTLPTTPVENWEQVRDEWVAAVEQFVSEVESWAKKRSWATLRDPKIITENRLGSYTVPRLLIHLIEGRLLMEPVARFVVGANGVIQWCLIPSFDWLSIVRTENGWFLESNNPDEAPQPWSEQVFEETARQLVRSA